MSRHTFVSPVLWNIEDFLILHSIPYQTGKNNMIIIPKYSIMGNDVEITIRYETARMLLTFKIEGETPYPKNILAKLYEYINNCNAKKVLGKYYISQKDRRLIFKLEHLLSEAKIIDSAIDAYLSVTTAGFLQVRDAIEIEYAKELAAASVSPKTSKP